MAELNTQMKVGGREIPDPWNRLRVRQALGEPMLLEAQFVAAAPPSNPKQHFADVLGKPFTLELRRNGDLGQFECLVAEASVHNEGYGLVGRGPLYGLTRAPRSRGFVDQSPKQVIEGVLGDAGVIADVRANIPLATNSLPYIAQYCETDFDFLHRLAGWVGLVVYEHGGKVIVAEAPKGPSVRLESTDIETARIVLEPAAVAGEAVAMDYAPHGKASASVSSTGLSSDSQYRSTLDSPVNALFNGPPAKLNDAYPKSPNALTDQLRARARQLVGRSIRYEFTTYRPDVQVGVVVEVSGHELISEKVFVIGISIDRVAGNARRRGPIETEDGYATRVVAVPEKMVGPVQLSVPPRVGMLSAIVADNKDPQNLGRVQLKFIWDDKATAWARIASISAGAKHGAFWVPQIDDEVLIDFEFGDPSRPIVVGSVYHSDALPSAETENGTGEVLLMRTDAGTEIRVVQAEGGDEIRFRIGEGGPQIQMRGKTIELTAENIKIDASGTVTINGSQIKLN